MCTSQANTYTCRATNPFEPLATIRFQVSFAPPVVRVTGTRYPSLELWRYDRAGARLTFHYDATTSPFGPLGLLAYGALGVARLPVK